MAKYDPNHFYALITGANSGLGLALCCRFATEFLTTRPANQKLTLVFTTRSEKKSLETTKYINAHIEKIERERLTGVGLRRQCLPLNHGERLRLMPASVDLCDLGSVLDLSRELKSKVPKLDYVFLNAGMAVMKGLNWPRAVWCVLTDLVNGVTYPDYKIQEVGSLAGQKWWEREGERGGKEGKAVLGTAFTANVFGHYVLVHEVMGLLERGGVSSLHSSDRDPSARESARVVWTSSIEAYGWTFSTNDIQCLQSEHSYESSKRLTDILVLTHQEKATEPYVNSYLTNSDPTTSTDTTTPSPPPIKPRFYLTHPGICGTSIAITNPILCWLMVAAFYIARLVFNSPWHCVTPWSGNSATMYVALTGQEELDAEDGQRVKWGAGAHRYGKEVVRRTEVLGLTDVVTERVGCERVRGRKVDLGKKGGDGSGGEEVLIGETREEFLEVGRLCWKFMEELRAEWMERLKNRRG